MEENRLAVGLLDRLEGFFGWEVDAVLRRVGLGGFEYEGCGWEVLYVVRGCYVVKIDCERVPQVNFSNKMFEKIPRKSN